MPKPSIILASASPRRQSLLGDAGIEFSVVIADVDELFETDQSDKRLIAQENAFLKASAVALEHPDAVVIGADTIVLSADGEVIGKPADEADAVRILTALSGTTHSVVTGVALICKSKGVENLFFEEAFVTMQDLSAELIQAYVDTGEPMGKAGAFAIQETADEFIEKIEGDFNTIVGLPVKMVVEKIEALLKH